MGGAHAGADPRPVRWLRLITGVVIAVPTLAAVVVASLALRTLERPVDLIVVAVAVLPVVAAVVVRRRLVWLASALPQLRAELRRLADQPEQPADDADDDPVVDRREAAAAAEELDRRLRDRVTVRGLWKAVRWLRSPAAQAGEEASRRLGPRAGATVSTTAGAAERIVGLVALSLVAVWGTAALVVGALVLALAAANGNAPG